MRELLAHSIPRRDIRHEVTPDSLGSGGRADIVVIVGDRLAGIEIKSGSDNLARCVEQVDAYARAFDRALFVVETGFPNGWSGLTGLLSGAAP